MSLDLVESKLGTVDNLPTLPMVLRQIQKVMNNPNSNMGQIAAVVAKDQALASRTIRLVNSAYYGLRNRIPSISQAIVVLGLNTLHNLMLGLSVVKLFEDSKMLGFDPEKFWHHSFGTALLSKKLGTLCGYTDPEECFIGGLLHDMGRLALQQFVHNEFEEALKTAALNNQSLLSAESKIMGFNHAEAGAWLARRWGLPELLISVLQYHHDCDSLPSQNVTFLPVVRIICFADQLCGQEKLGSSGENIYPVRTIEGMLSSTNPKVRKLIEEVKMEKTSVFEEWTKAG